jgi:spore coat polysaccharide biosynthesis protein SpsF
VAIIQARMGSVRLPGKVLMDLGGAPMLVRVIERVGRAHLDQVIVATSSSPADDAVAAVAAATGVPVFRGAETDVLDRFYQTAKAHRADVIVRVTADCPLIDPGVIDRVVTAFQQAEPSVDFASNCLVRSYPQGLDVEVTTLDALSQAWAEAWADYERAHVMPFIYRHPDRFRLLNVQDTVDRSTMRWTVDTPDDLAFVRAVYARLGNHDAFSWTDVLQVLQAEPDVATLNRHVRQKTLEEG